MNKALNIIKLLLGWPLSAIAILFIVRFLINNSSNININFHDINYFFILVSFASFASYFLIRSFVWKKILKFEGFEIPFKDNLYFWSFSEVKRYVPGNIWSFLGRATMYSKINVDKKTVFKSLLTEVQLLIVACSILSIGSIFFAVSQFRFEDILAYLFIILVIASSLIFIFGNRIKILKFHKLLPKFSWNQNIYLLVLSFIAFLFFGIGTYFSAVSLFDLKNLSPLLLVSFFTLSFLIGFVSFITPMGLGVREAIITLGLASVIGVYSAGALSIYTRIIFVISEAIFLFFVLCFTRGDLMLSYIRKYRWEILLFIGIAFYNIYFNIASYFRYQNYYTGRFDLGNMAQTVWNTAHGKFFTLTDPNGVKELSRLAYHADFILVLLTPLYMLWSSPLVLLLIQTVVLSFGAVFVYLISREILKSKSISAIFGLSFLLYPAVEYVNLYDFHGVALATTFLLAAFYFMIKKKYKTFIIFLILAGICKEEIWVITAVFGLYVAYFNKKYILGLSIFGISLATFYVLIWHAIPNALGSEHFALSYYSDFGSSPSSVIKNIIFSPVKTLSTLFRKEQLDYIKQLFIPLGYSSVFAPIILVFAGPDLVIDLLSNNPQLHQIYYQYSSSITPFVFISSIYGISFLSKRFKEISILTLTFIIIIFTLASSYSFGPLPIDSHPSIEMFTMPVANKAFVDSYLNKIPDSASIASTNNLGSHLSERGDIYTVPYGINKADYVIFLLNDRDEPQYNSEKAIALGMNVNSNYILVYSKDNFLVFKKISKNL